jgi:hypothetical protein
MVPNYSSTFAAGTTCAAGDQRGRLCLGLYSTRGMSVSAYSLPPKSGLKSDIGSRPASRHKRVRGARQGSK